MYSTQFQWPRSCGKRYTRKIAHCQCLGDYVSNKNDAGASRTVYGFQCNERYLEWDESAGVSFYAANEVSCRERQIVSDRYKILDILCFIASCRDSLFGYTLHVLHNETDIDFVNERLQEPKAILPDLMSNFERLNATLIYQLIKDLDKIAQRMIGLRRILPGLDVSSMVVGNVWLLNDEFSLEKLEENYIKWKTSLSDHDVGKILQTEPRLLQADIDLIMKELVRLMPNKDPSNFIARDPSYVLSMNNAGLHSSLLTDDGISEC